MNLPPQCVRCARHDHAWDEPCTPATRCRRSDAVEGLLVCRRCYERIQDNLRAIPELYALAADELQPGQGDGARSSTPSIGLRVAALDLRAGGDALERLATWERDWREHFDIDPVGSGHYLRGGTASRHQAVDRYARGRDDWARASLVGVIGFLLEQLHRAASAHYAIDDFARDVEHIHAQAVEAARMGARPGWQVECPADHADGICGAPIRVTGEHFGGTVECRRCRTTWDVSRLLRVVGSTRDADVWLPAEEIALLVGVSERTLRRWATGGQIRRQGGRYSLDDVRTAIANGTTRRDEQA